MAFVRNRVLEGLVRVETATAAASGLGLWIFYSKAGAHSIFSIFDFGTL
jgi:hypothetical protein